jgi:hypothetical protein
MKKILVLLFGLCIALSTIAAPWDIKSPKYTVANKAFENVTILWYTPEYYPANYWYSGQAAGYFLFLSLEGLQEATWELSVGIETTVNGITSMKIFVFTVPGGYGTVWHDHVLDMASQMSPGETIPEDAETSINYWWIVS